MTARRKNVTSFGVLPFLPVVESNDGWRRYVQGET